MTRLDAHVNEWGIPDWRKPEDYGSTAKWDLDRWRWEFTRRRADYRAAFEAAFREWAAVTVRPSEIEPAFEARERWHLTRVPSPSIEGAERYGLTCFFDPTVSDWTEPAHFVFPASWAGPRWPRTGFKAHKTRRPLDPDAPHLVPCTFDVSRPLAPQLQEAEAELKAWQAKLAEYGTIELRKPRLHRTKWLCYLRVLDARAARASWGDIVPIIPIIPKRKLPDRDTARDVHDQAEDQFWF